jgi:uncharacterized protein (TIGR03437 family)
MGKALSVSLKSIVGLCVCLGVAGALSAQPAVNFSISGTLGPVISGTDPLGLSGKSFTATTSINPVGLPVISGSSYTYTGLSVHFVASPFDFTCPATTATVTVINPAVNGVGATFALSNCSVLGIPVQATLAFPPNTLVSPMPLAFSASMVTTNNASSLTYVSTSSTTLGVSGSTTATCVNCPAMTLTPGTLTFNGQAGGVAPLPQSVTVSSGGTVLDYALVTSTTSGGNWLSVSPSAGQTGGSFSVTVNPSTLTQGTYTGSVKVYSAVSNSPQTVTITFNVSAPPFSLVASPTSFTFNSVTGGTTPAQSLSVTTSPASSVPYTAAASTNDGNAWLSVSPTSGTTGGTPLSIAADPTRVPTGGTYTGKVTLTSAGATNSPLPLNVTFNVTKVAVSPASLTFNSTAGGPNPPSQNLSVTSTGPSNISYTAAVTSGSSWLSVSPGSGTTNVTALSVSVNNSSLTAGSYNGTISITPAGATTPIPVPVSVTVAQAPSMIPNPTSLTFTSNAGAVPVAQTLNLTSSGAAISYNVSANTASGGNWLTVSPGSGATPGSVQVSINSGVLAGLATGTYTGNVVFTATTGASNSPLSVPVTLNVTAALTPSPSSLTFNYVINGTAPGPQAVGVTSNGGPISYSAAASTSSGGNWLSVSPGSATTPTGISTSVNPAGLAAGKYTGTITLTSAGATNSPVTIPVTLNVISVTVQPTSLSFAGQAGGSNPASQSLSVASSAGSGNPVNLSFTASASTTSGGSWLSVAPASGTTNSTSLSVSVNTSGLAAATYQGSVTVTVAGAPPVTVPVTLTVGTNVLSVLPASLSFSYDVGGAQPASQNLNVTSTGIVLNATATPGASWLSVTPSSGNTPAAFAVSIVTAGLTPGNYNSTISISAANAANSPVSVPVTLTVSPAPSLISSPASLTFTSNSGAVPAAQTLNLSSSGSAISYTVAATTSSGGNWLTVSPGSGTTPGNTQVSINSSVLAGLATGTYTGNVVFTAASAANSPLSVPVTLKVGATLTPAPASLTFNYAINGTVPVAQAVAVTSSGGAISYTAAASTTSGGNWLSVSPASATTPTGISASVNPAGLAAGKYTGTITLASAGATNSPVTIPVTLNVISVTVAPTSLSFSGQTGGGNPGPQSLSVASSAGTGNPVNLSFTASASTTSGGSWLSVTPASGTTNSTSLSVSVNIAGLAAATYQGSITVTAAGAGPVAVPVTLTVGTGVLTLAPASLSFSYATGGTVPAAQSLAVSTSNGGTPAITVTAATSSGGNWLTASAAGANTPTSVMVSLNQAVLTGLAVGDYSGTITVSATGYPTQTASVALVVSKPKATIVVTGNLAFAIPNTAPPTTSVVTISASDNSALPFTVAAGSPAASWLSFSPASGTTPGKVTLTVNPAGQAPGLHLATLTVTMPGSADGSKAITVQLQITGSNLTATPASLSFTYQPGGTLPAGQTLVLAPASGTGTIALSSVTTNVPWLKVSSLASAPGNIQVTFVSSPLAAGSYLGSIIITAVGSPTASLAVPVELTVNAMPQLTASPAALTFNYQPGGALPAPQSIALATGDVPLSFSVSSPGTWLSVSPARGATPGSVLVAADPTGLGAGSYSGTIGVSAYGASNPASIAVTLNVLGTGQQLTVTPAELSFAVPVGGTAPAQSLSVASAGSAIGFTAMTSGAKWLSVTPASGTTPGSVSVSVNAAGLLDGTYTGTIAIEPSGLSSGGQVVTVTLKVGTGISVPTIAGVINAASGTIGKVAPGMLVSIFGQGLGPQAGVPFAVPPSGGTVATELEGTQVFFDGVPVPILYTQDGQVNAIAPFELAGKATTLLEIEYNNVKSAGMTLQVVDAEPGLFTADGSGKGQGAILNQDYSANSSSMPAAAGSAVILFGTGGGQTDPASTDGQINPLTAGWKLVLPVTVTIGGQPADVLYYGPAPGLVGGVIQINAVIPAGTPSGPAPVVVTLGTASTTQTVTVAVQ